MSTGSGNDSSRIGDNLDSQTHALERKPTWRSSMMLRIILLVFSFIILATGLLYISDFVGASVSVFMRLMAGVLASIGAALLGAWVLRDPIRGYISEILRAGVSNKNFLKNMSRESLKVVIRSALAEWSDWCAPAMSELVLSADQYPQVGSKQNTHYSWSLTDCDDDIRIEFSGCSLMLNKDDYLSCTVTDDVQYEANSLTEDMYAVFVIQRDVLSSIDLASQFLDGSVLYRDFLYFTKNLNMQLAETMTRQNAPYDLSVNDNPLAELVDIYLEVEEESIKPSLVTPKVVVKPDELIMQENMIAFRFKEPLKSMTMRFESSKRVRVRMVASTKVHLSTGDYPIVFSTFTYDPEIRVRFSSKKIVSHNWVSFMDPGRITHEIDDDGRGYRLHTRLRSSGRPSWILPGNGISIRWEVNR